MFQRFLFGSGLRAQICRQGCRAHGSGSGQPIHASSPFPQNASPFSATSNAGFSKNSITEKHLQSSLLGNLGLVRPVENVTLPYALAFKSSIHSGKRAEDEAGRAPPRSMDYVQGLLHEKGNNVTPPLYHPQGDSFQGILQERGNSFSRLPPFYQPHLESNADIVHIKLLRNNAFVTVTDSKGNKKIGVSAGKLAGKGGKLNRYSGEAAAEFIGREVRRMKTRSVVVKVNGFTFFRRKKDAILSFKDGYSNSRGDMNPIVYLEDTTRKPHNGCRLPKKRRI